MAKRLVLFWDLVLNLTFPKLRITLLMRIPICFWIRHRLALWLQSRIPARTSTTPVKAEVPKVLPASEQKRKHLPLPIRYPSSQAFLFLPPSSLWNPFFHSLQAIVSGIFTLFVDPRIRAKNHATIMSSLTNTSPWILTGIPVLETFFLWDEDHSERISEIIQILFNCWYVFR